MCPNPVPLTPLRSAVGIGMHFNSQSWLKFCRSPVRNRVRRHFLRGEGRLSVTAEPSYILLVICVYALVSWLTAVLSRKTLSGQST